MPTQESCVWEDLRFPANSFKLGGVSPPGWVAISGASYGNLLCLAFAKASDEEVFLFGQIPHSWTQGTEVRPHVHWINHNDTTGTVRWGLEYTFASPNGFFPSTPTTIYAEDDCEAQVGGEIKHQIASFSAIDMAGHTVSCMFILRLFRDADHANDDADDDVGLLEFDMHYQRNSGGSPEEYSKP